MTAKEIDRFRQTEALFHAALEHPSGAQRDGWLQDQCARDEEMLAAVRHLLEDHEEVSRAVLPPAEPLPQFGLWNAVRLLGRGGMGVVYLAERADGAFRMTAAVKVVPLALASLEVEERFRRERQFLASLEHPKIARLIDGGVTGAGLPYLVMEFVDGLNIERYCDTRQLDTRGRIALVRQVLEALVYVHSQQVIHRDLKPSNILVDSAGTAKLLDFGTARLVDAGGDMAITKTGVFAFTPECASPEQVQGKPVTFASDIYAAGVLLYRLLTRREPYQFSGHSNATIADTISHTEPTPSGLDAPLDAILSKALRKNPEDRYQAADELDADLARYLGGEPVEARRPRNKSWMPVAAALIVVGLAVASWLFHRPAAPALPTSIAVLPFTNVGGNPANLYLSDGLTGEITDALTHLKGLRVIARSSAFQFRGKENDLRTIGSQLNVTHVLEGRVERSADRVKTTVRLDRVSDLSQIWSNTYERQKSDLFSLQSVIAAAIAASLGAPVSVTHPAKHVVQDAEARDAYMHGVYEMEHFSPESFARADADFRHAIDRDPQYALAYEYLGAVAVNRAGSLSGNIPEKDLRLIETLWRKALELDPELEEPRAALASFAMQKDWNWARAEEEYRAVLASGPSATAEQLYALLLIFQGRFREAEPHLQTARTLNPFSTAQIDNLGLARRLEGRFEESRGEYQRALALHPDALLPRLMCDYIDIQLGKPLEALADLKRLEPVYHLAPTFEAMALARAGRRDEALKQVRLLEAGQMNQGLPRHWIASVYAFLGDEANAVEYLEKSADRREYQAMYMGVEPVFAFLRNNPRFRALKKRMGLER